MGLACLYYFEFRKKKTKNGAEFPRRVSFPELGIKAEEGKIRASEICAVLGRDQARRIM
jgi:hypothetical protein